MLHSLKACWRLLHAVGHALAGWWTIRFTFPGLSQAERNARVQEWSRRMLEIMGITLKVQGTPPPAGPVLLISNHLSWLDITAIHAARHVRFVSKSGVKHWPLIGTLSTGAGSLYIERERRRDALRVVHHMTEALREGDLIGVFPEGTTSDGRGLLPFHANLLQAAISSGAPVLPAALRFADAATGETSQAPRYIDDDNLVTSLWNTLRAPPLLAIVRFGEPQDSHGRERRAWAQSLHEDVQQLRRETH
ncbi:1-acyl-sn-glycerol-3-phosphate acyltransferase [Variovorax boronicumulans]|uniref:lysophospholipid acyltransferase family protein n=1 Tax=Variovorax boronicumulans TaxID=436515 RepID=UPI00159D07DD|nr:lysophospholipid acyltransferase family protein [Variovorax boronicumulans]MDQ0014309.1 1-acyl-sn-glycerol-3-phosphate acyltransferase [Variovorax boronicumulans]